jgi:hypothetical protein
MSGTCTKSPAGKLSKSILAIAFTLLAGCHSRFVETTIDNQSPTPLRLVEVDYPSASFGAEAIPANSIFNYHFKVQGSGKLKLEFTDAEGKVHDVDGPQLSEGQEGHLTITIDSAENVTWHPSLSNPQ